MRVIPFYKGTHITHNFSTLVAENLTIKFRPCWSHFTNSLNDWNKHKDVCHKKDNVILVASAEGAETTQ
jgi:hypothetical protein